MESFLSRLSVILRGTVTAPAEVFGETLEEEHLRGGEGHVCGGGGRKVGCVCGRAGGGEWGAEVLGVTLEEEHCIMPPAIAMV